jgi:phytoene dehydrogenase-like protein
MPSSSIGNSKSRIVVIGAGIGGLTAAALLSKRGYQVLVLDQALVPGGCASTFKRRGFTFDVGRNAGSGTTTWRNSPSHLLATGN